MCRLESVTRSLFVPLRTTAFKRMGHTEQFLSNHPIICTTVREVPRGIGQRSMYPPFFCMSGAENLTVLDSGIKGGGNIEGQGKFSMIWSSSPSESLHALS